MSLRVRFFKKIQDWILKSERIRKRTLCFFIKQINPRSLGSWCIKGTEESTLEMDSSVPLMHHDPRDLGLICVIKKHKIRFRILSDLRIQSWIFLKKRTLIFKVQYLSSMFSMHEINFGLAGEHACARREDISILLSLFCCVELVRIYNAGKTTSVSISSCRHFYCNPFC